MTGLHDDTRRRVADGRADQGGIEAAHLAAIITAGRRAWAASSHPEPASAACPRPGCGAEPGDPCSTTGGTVLPWGHRERHAAAIAADGRTCAAEEGS